MENFHECVGEKEWGASKAGRRPYKLGELTSRGPTTNKVRDQQRTRRRVCGQTHPKCLSRLIKGSFTRLLPFPYTFLCYRIFAALKHHFYSHLLQWLPNPLPPLARPLPPPLPRLLPSRLRAPRQPRRPLPPRQPPKVVRKRRSVAKSARRHTLRIFTRVSCLHGVDLDICSHKCVSAQAGAPRYWYLQQGDGHFELFRQRHLRTHCHRGL